MEKNKFKDKAVSLSNKDVALNNQVVADKEINILNAGIVLDSNPLDTLNIPTTIKRGNKTYYIDSRVANTLEVVAKKQKISSSKLLEHILKSVLEIQE